MPFPGYQVKSATMGSDYGMADLALNALGERAGPLVSQIAGGGSGGGSGPGGALAGLMGGAMNGGMGAGMPGGLSPQGAMSAISGSAISGSAISGSPISGLLGSASPQAMMPSGLPGAPSLPSLAMPSMPGLPSLAGMPSLPTGGMPMMEPLRDLVPGTPQPGFPLRPPVGQAGAQRLADLARQAMQDPSSITGLLGQAAMGQGGSMLASSLASALPGSAAGGAAGGLGSAAAGPAADMGAAMLSSLL